MPASTTNVFTQAWSKKVLDAITQNTAYASGIRGSGVNMFVALLTAVGTGNDDATLTEFTGYSEATRPGITFSSVTGGSGTSQQTVSTNNQTFTITGNATIVAIAITTSNTKGATLVTTGAGDVIWFGGTSSDITVTNGNSLLFPTGQITVNLG